MFLPAQLDSESASRTGTCSCFTAINSITAVFKFTLIPVDIGHGEGIRYYTKFHLLCQFLEYIINQLLIRSSIQMLNKHYPRKYKQQTHSSYRQCCSVDTESLVVMS